MTHAPTSCPLKAAPRFTSPPSRERPRSIPPSLLTLQSLSLLPICSRHAQQCAPREAAYAPCSTRSRARMTVIADHGLPVDVDTLRSFRMRAISCAGVLASRLLRARAMRSVPKVEHSTETLASNSGVSAMGGGRAAFGPHRSRTQGRYQQFTRRRSRRGLGARRLSRSQSNLASV
jgi:hypothetical protein